MTKLDVLKPLTLRGVALKAFGFAVLTLLIVGLESEPAHAVLTNGNSAIDIFGQFSSITTDTTGVYTTNCVNNGASPIGIATNGNYFTPPPSKIALDLTNHWLFVSDWGNSRILVFPLNSSNVLSSKTPTYIFGTAGDPHSCFAEGWSTPMSLAVDPVNHWLYVGQGYSSAVYVYSTSSMSNGEVPTYILGAGTGALYNNYQGGGLTAANIAGAGGVAIDVADQLLYVADPGNLRILVFNVASGSLATGESASYEIGVPSGSAAFTTAGTGALTASTLTPTGLAYDSVNKLLYAADSNHDRILVFNVASGTLANGESASYVLGQPDFVTDNAASGQSGLAKPQDVDVDSTHNLLYVADSDNSRIMVFNVATGTIANGENASYVLGEPNFTTVSGGSFGNGTNTSQSTMDSPGGVAIDPVNQILYAIDTEDSRVMMFGTASLANGENASDEIGQYASATSTATVNWTHSGLNNSGNALGFFETGDLTIDPVNHWLFVADVGNDRVLVFPLKTDNSVASTSGGHTASYVLGQPDFATVGDEGCTASSIRSYTDGMFLAFDTANTRLFVSDANNNRVLVFNTSSISNNMAASYVLGQTSLTSCGFPGASASTFNSGPAGLAYDAVNNRLFVADPGANRVLVFTTVAPGSIANGAAATYAIGQTNLTKYCPNKGALSGGNCPTTPAASSTTLNGPGSLSYDPVNTRLFVGDVNSNRVLAYSVPTGSTLTNLAASQVIGQTGFTGANANQGNANPSATSLNLPESISYDANNSRLFVTDNDNNRLLVFNVVPGPFKSGVAASFELGVPSGTTALTTQGTANVAASTLDPAFVHYDPGSSKLFVADESNRVLVFDGSFMSTWTPGDN